MLVINKYRSLQFVIDVDDDYSRVNDTSKHVCTGYFGGFEPLYSQFDSSPVER